MLERPAKSEVLEIKSALTDEQLKSRVREGVAMSPEERETARQAHMAELQHAPSIKLTSEEMQALEERKNREEQKAA